MPFAVDQHRIRGGRLDLDDIIKRKITYLLTLWISTSLFAVNWLALSFALPPFFLVPDPAVAAQEVQRREYDTVRTLLFVWVVQLSIPSLVLNSLVYLWHLLERMPNPSSFQEGSNPTKIREWNSISCHVAQRVIWEMSVEDWERLRFCCTNWECLGSPPASLLRGQWWLVSG